MSNPDANKKDKSVKDLVMLLSQTSLVTSGFSLEDPNTFGFILFTLVSF
jgi:molecular chaperone HtpG